MKGTVRRSSRRAAAESIQSRTKGSARGLSTKHLSNAQIVRSARTKNCIIGSVLVVPYSHGFGSPTV
eukprot:scaffold184454_cov27-Prasinocladus_malaysianus.AAC.1